MPDHTYFTQPVATWQRQYEALRAYLVEGLSAAQVASRFGLDQDYVRQLAHRFRRGKLPWLEEDWHPGDPEGAAQDGVLRERIIALRQQDLSNEAIVQRLAQEGTVLSERTVARVLSGAGLPRRVRRRAGERLGEQLEREPAAFPPEPLDTPLAGLLLLAPIMEELDVEDLAGEAGCQGPDGLPPGWLRLLLAAKLAGLGGGVLTPAHEHYRLAHLVAGFAQPVSATAAVRQAWSLEPETLRRWQAAWTRRRRERWPDLAGEDAISLGARQMGQGEAAWAGAPAPVAAGALGGAGLKNVALALALDAPHVLLDGWVEPRRGNLAEDLLDEAGPWRRPGRLIVCGAKQLTYEELDQLDRVGMHFIIHQRSGKKIEESLKDPGRWHSVSFPQSVPPLRQAQACELAGAEAQVPYPGWRQIAFRAEGQGLLLLLTNHPAFKLRDVIGHFLAHRRLQRGTLDDLAFFHPRRSPQACPLPLALDLLLTQAAQAAYGLLKRRLGQEQASASWLFEHWIRLRGQLIPEAEGVRLRIAHPGAGTSQMLKRWLPGWVRLELVS